MSRRAKPGPNRWRSETYVVGYVQNRAGVAVLRYRQRSLSTGRVFSGVNRAVCLEDLDRWIERIESGADDAAKAPVVPAVASVKALAILYTDPDVWRPTATERRRQRDMMRTFFADDCELVPQLVAARMQRVITTTALERSTLTKRIAQARRMFGWGVRMKHLTENPVDALERLPARKRRDVLVFSRDDVERICWHFVEKDITDRRRDDGAGAFLRHGYRHTHYIYLWRFLYLTACRIEEALKLRWSDYRDGVLTIDGKREHADEPKLRGFPVASFPELVELLEELRGVSGDGDRLFPWWSVTKAPGDAFRSALRDLGMYRKGLSVKTLRASAGERWLDELGLSDQLIADLSGHTVEVRKSSYRPDRMAGSLARQIERETSSE